MCIKISTACCQTYMLENAGYFDPSRLIDHVVCPRSGSSVEWTQDVSASPTDPF